MAPPTATASATQTQPPTQTPTATSEPTPTPKVMVPALWDLYEHPGDVFTLHCPPEWTPRDEFSGGVIFDLPDGSWLLLGLVLEPTKGDVGDQDTINMIVREIMDEHAGDQVRILSKGAWPAPTGANFVEYRCTEITRDGQYQYHDIYAEKPIDHERWWFVSLSQMDDTLAEGEIEALKLVLASLQLRPGAEAVYRATPQPSSTLRTDSKSSMIEVTEWAWRPSVSGNYIEIQGVVKNVSEGPMRRVRIYAILRDADHNFLSTDWSYINVDVLLPGEEATWSILTRNPGAVKQVELKNITWD